MFLCQGEFQSKFTCHHMKVESIKLDRLKTEIILFQLIQFGPTGPDALHHLR